jgi:hypothetical protein
VPHQEVRKSSCPFTWSSPSDASDRGRIELPFGQGKTSPVAAADVALVVAAVLWAGYTNSPVRGHRTCTGSPGSSQTR